MMMIGPMFVTARVISREKPDIPQEQGGFTHEVEIESCTFYPIVVDLSGEITSGNALFGGSSDNWSLTLRVPGPDIVKSVNQKAVAHGPGKVRLVSLVEAYENQTTGRRTELTSNNSIASEL